ncbi:hydroxymethylglutaryl-CoA lyase [Rhodococcus sp. NPDC058514]|uniref:hydroxymethylglutaryl-CoA lyase n=1 Tax=unclassified Rhodococcus (in: high G+C Gram-positive bacteria) TaxID=192944 RepID=UPI00365F7BD0
MASQLPERVHIREVGLRDGLQNEDPISVQAKESLLDAVVATGVQRVEATAFVSSRAVPSMADAEEVAALLHRWPGVRFSALIASPGGARRAVAAGITDLEYVVSAGDGHSRSNVRIGTDEATAQIGEVARVIHDAGGHCEVAIATAWDCPFDGPTPPERVLRIASRARELGADSLSLADTIGTATPVRVRTLIGAVRDRVGPAELGVHFHNTRGAGLACAVAAVEAGVVHLDASAGGLGGCPFAPGASGNIATEELVYLLHDMGIGTGIDLNASIAAAEAAQRVVGHPVPSNLLRAGDRKRG